MSDYTCFVGVDIAAKSASVVIGHNRDTLQPAFTIRQTADGMNRLVSRLETLADAPSQTLIVMEATGNYWMQLAVVLHEAGFAVSVINPAQARYFARAKLQRAKTDAIDARVLCELGITLQPAPWTPPPAVYERLHQLLCQRDALISMKVDEQNRLHALLHRPDVEPLVREMIDAHIAYLKQQIKAVEREIAAALTSDPEWAASATRLCSIPGIGLMTAAWILTTTLNFAYCENPAQVTAYAGLAPYVRHSGSSLHGYAAIGYGGNARLRRALYMAAVTAVRCNPNIRSFYHRLRERGKVTKMALCAAARKLLHIAWAIVTKQRMFDPNHERKAYLARQKA